VAETRLAAQVLFQNPSSNAPLPPPSQHQMGAQNLLQQLQAAAQQVYPDRSCS
jgi:hypothetical protein